MQIKTLLNYKGNFKGFVYQIPQLDKKREALLVPVIRPVKTARPNAYDAALPDQPVIIFLRGNFCFHRFGIYWLF
ncbi:MAG: hypothetical protein CSA32_01865 [Desulfobulbus propionicus]|nr:MAG: hypothetical protein CSA32_01865 [Desulfobulbus propionicus]